MVRSLHGEGHVGSNLTVPLTLGLVVNNSLQFTTIRGLLEVPFRDIYRRHVLCTQLVCWRGRRVELGSSRESSTQSRECTTTRYPNFAVATAGRIF